MKEVKRKVDHAHKVFPDSASDANELIMAVWEIDELELTAEQKEHIRLRCSPADEILAKGANKQRKSRPLD